LPTLPHHISKDVLDDETGIGESTKRKRGTRGNLIVPTGNNLTRKEKKANVK